jgi:hypothetical protein
MPDELAVQALHKFALIRVHVFAQPLLHGLLLNFHLFMGCDVHNNIALRFILPIYVGKTQEVEGIIASVSFCVPPKTDDFAFIFRKLQTEFYHPLSEHFIEHPRLVCALKTAYKSVCISYHMRFAFVHPRDFRLKP